MRDFMVVATCCIYMRRLSLAQAFVADLHVAQSLATQKMKTGLANTPPTKGSSISGWSLSKIHPFRKTISSEATSVTKWIRHCNTLKPTKPYKTTGANSWSMSISCRWAFQHVWARSFRTAAACAWKQFPLLRSGQVIVLHIFTVFSYIYIYSPLLH